MSDLAPDPSGLSDAQLRALANYQLPPISLWPSASPASQGLFDALGQGLPPPSPPSTSLWGLLGGTASPDPSAGAAAAQPAGQLDPSRLSDPQLGGGAANASRLSDLFSNLLKAYPNIAAFGSPGSPAARSQPQSATAPTQLAAAAPPPNDAQLQTEAAVAPSQTDASTPTGQLPPGQPQTQQVADWQPRCVQSAQNAAKLDYSQRLYKGGTQTTQDHIIERHLSGLPGVSQYNTSGGFPAVERTNALTFQNGTQNFRNRALEFDLNIVPPPLSAFFSTGTNQAGEPTIANRLVVAPDCHTVVTSYPR